MSILDCFPGNSLRRGEIEIVDKNATRHGENISGGTRKGSVFSFLSLFLFLFRLDNAMNSRGKWFPFAKTIVLIDDVNLTFA